MYDKIQLELNNIKLSRVELSMEGTLERENILLEPISLTLNICRNLTISWLKQQPEVDIQANLKPIKISVSDEDFQVVLSVLQDNLKEQVEAAPPEETLVADSTGETVSEGPETKVLLKLLRLKGENLCSAISDTKSNVIHVVYQYLVGIKPETRRLSHLAVRWLIP
ncbi:Vacuolar protein sorting-associated protein 13C [Chionoecetes opilio]|uniref:Vacuolar protein sorting-associated protein 13C n=1 Tax=Chionoecetes opilio TaxID=41210 RepID=A0A8J4Y8H5_CHIOP|nr:Vacuolar protein sorting-associated protein 13C [Chionoecetes opilio]